MTKLLRSAVVCVAVAGCMPMGPRSTQPPPPVSDADMAAYQASLLAHPYTGGKMMTAVNHLATRVCRVTILAEAGGAAHAPTAKQYVNQAGPADPERGSLEPADRPFLEAQDESPVFYPNVPDPQPAQMIVTALGCLRTRDGQFFPDERTVLMEKHMAVAVNGKIVLAPH